MPQGKPYSEACVRNREPILAVLAGVFAAPGAVLEIGSGTGQHAAYFAQRLPHLVWQPTDIALHLPGIRAWRDADGSANLLEPIALDVTDEVWPITRADYVFSANTAHILSWPEVDAMFHGVGRLLPDGHCFCLYGPFNYGGDYTSASNAEFDRHLKARDPAMGIRDLAALTVLAAAAGMAQIDDVAMPANNRTQVWRKQS